MSDKQPESGFLKKLERARIDAGYSPLHVASEDGRIEDVVELLGSNEGRGTDDFQGGGKTALMLAALEGHSHVARELLSHGADINKKGEKCGQTALHFAAGCGQNEVVDLLVMKGAEVDVYSEESMAPLDLASEGGHLRVINTLVIKGSTVYPDIIGRLRCGVEEEFRAMFNLLLDGKHEKIGDEGPGEFLQRALLMAAKHGNLPVVKALSTKGVDLDGTAQYYPIPGVDSDPATALHAAASEGKHDVVIYLLDNRVRIDPVDGVFNTPLLWSVEGNHPRVAATLLEAGADMEMENAGGYSSVYVAAHWASVDMALRLLRYGAEFNSSRNGSSILHEAMRNRDNIEAMVDLLLRWGADETVVNSYGDTPMDYLTENTSYGHSAETKERVRNLLVNAPVDRTWRRRGWLVMLRSRTLKVGGDGGSSGELSGKRLDRSGGGKESFDLFAAMDHLSMVEDGVFRNVVGFL